MSSLLSKSSYILVCAAFAISGCTTTNTTTTATSKVNNPIAKLASLSPVRSVDPDLAQACINSAANRYFLPTRVIKAVDSRKAGDGSVQVILKVDLRDAVCTVSASGVVKSVVDTSPKSADQIAAEELAAKAASTTQKVTTEKSVQPKKAAKKAVKKAEAQSGQSLY